MTAGSIPAREPCCDEEDDDSDEEDDEIRTVAF